MPNPVEERAIQIAIKYLQRQGYQVTNVSKGKRRNSEHKGYDLLVQQPGGDAVKIEVKGCTRRWGIPDPYETEFKDGRLVADYLYVVYMLDREPVQLCAIHRCAFKPEHIKQKMGYRISSRFKNERILKEFLQPLGN